MRYYLAVSTNPGISYAKGVCDEGRRVSVVEAFGIFTTVSTAAHELGHNLGADHDEEDDAKACDPNDLFIMSPNETAFVRGKPYSRNPWMFSNCSVEAFKTTLPNKYV
ncbi:hypothetical protein CHS0354_013730 [Potamilus streckersoni]|uniref:Peptidase M12B domain-containing protein n=1 Tax=Potamilus streckersoni TaxID=2493646 RepID=A0AAE0VSE0_9BIVA|nr:hypothetical protein CHS0354_013730 [Potamilus streckersoni]